ncbi:MAG: class I SAM-dependent rRNA methyltransferase [Gammaproteobacteria bacterium]|nr:class I SAM-dependent rRNA methyltransferase [Gammaproteobacteria bacterium]
MSLPELKLRKNEERRLKAGHLWVFSNEVDVKATPLTAFKPGEQVQVVAQNGKPLGIAYVNPKSLIAARLLTHGKAAPVISGLIVHRLNQALGLRKRLFDEPFYRLVFGESDGLPGLIVDRFDQVLVVQVSTAGMEAMKDDIIAALQKVVKPAGIVFQNHVPMRELEGLPLGEPDVIGDVPAMLDVVENGIRYAIDFGKGQKTGWFFDQRENRLKLPRYAEGKRVLDVFSYAGGWGLTAAKAGAGEVTLVDSSSSALAMARQNAALNDVDLRLIEGDAFKVLADLREAGEKFDVVVVDPPAFIKRKKDYKAGLAAYQRINQAALQVLETDGILVSCSCSQHLSEQDLARAIQRAARHVDRFAQILEHCHQASDHPEHPAIPETRYLKGYVTRILPGT